MRRVIGTKPRCAVVAASIANGLWGGGSERDAALGMAPRKTVASKARRPLLHPARPLLTVPSSITPQRIDRRNVDSGLDWPGENRMASGRALRRIDYDASAVMSIAPEIPKRTSKLPRSPRRSGRTRATKRHDGIAGERYEAARDHDRGRHRRRARMGVAGSRCARNPI